ncbi:wax ester synthase/diacylglycerol acyltransferase 4-like [Aristolochia californica]|uniref:wax ester synthase/diacylglycerol acyltransferase 4-like n=1 Tax=Aristolochia californica TaxID=171875 RepID=UPI0035E1A301
MASHQKKPSMTSFHSRQEVAAFEEDEEEYIEPLSPNSGYIYTKELSLGVIVVFESEIPVNDSQTFVVLRELLLPINPRFSSILVRDEKGVRNWKKVKVSLEDHVKVPLFPEGLSAETYGGHLQKYLAQMAMEPVPENKPLWEIHIFKYPTLEAAGTILFKLHHAMGDGFSLMGALFSCLKRADDPSLPLTFPSAAKLKFKSEKNVCKRVSKAVAAIWNTVYDVTRSVLKSTVLEDDTSAIRSGHPHVESQPVVLSTVVLSLKGIREVKSKVSGTVNDVVMGILFYGIHLYNKRMGQTSQHMTSLVLLNTRMVSGYQNVQEMLEADTWGNKFTFLQVSIPSCENIDKVNPLIFISKANATIKRKRNSLEVFFVGTLLKMLQKMRGHEAVSRYIYKTLKNTTLATSNMIGPAEKIQIANHPVKNFYFFVTGAPQSLGTMVLSYMEKLTIAMVLQEGFVAPQLLVSCINDAFEKIHQVANGK